MTTTADQATRATFRAPTARPTFAGVLRSEWIKLTSVRSIVVSLIVGAALAAAISMLATLAIIGSSPGPLPAIDAAMFGTMGIQVTQLVFAIVGVIAITGEYASGQIRSSLTAVPKRLPMLVAKAAVLGAIAFVVGAIAIVAGSLLSAVTAIAMGMDASAVSFDGAAQAVLGGAAYLALLTVFALGVGTMLRSGAGAIAIVMSLLLVVPIVLGSIPVEWVQTMSNWQLMIGGADLATADLGDQELLARAVVTVVAWPALALAGGAALLAKRDA